MELVASGVVYPTPAEYAARIVQSVGAMAPVVGAPVGSANDIVTPPMRAFVGGLESYLEGSTGIPLHELAALAQNIAALSQATDPQAIIAGVGAVLDASIQVAVSIAEAAGVAASAVAIIPVIGQMIGGVLDTLVSSMNATAAARASEQACHQRAIGAVNERCKELMEQARPLKTRTDGPTPSDLFRPVLYSYQEKQPWSAPTGGGLVLPAQGRGRLPLSPASLYVLLCEDEMPERWWRDYQYGFLVAQYVHRDPKRRVAGIERNVRRKMWTLLKAILAGVEKPGPSRSPKRFGDGGAAAYAMLQDVVWTARDRGRIDDRYVRNMARVVGLPFVWTFESGEGFCADTAKLGISFSERCDDRVAESLYGGFYEGLNDYQQRLFDAWENLPMVASQIAIRKPGAAVLQLSPAATQILGERIERPFRLPSAGERAVVGASIATLASAGAWALLTLL